MLLMKQRIKLLFVILYVLLLMVSLTGCHSHGKLNEGDSKCTIAFKDIPKEFTMLEENLLDNLKIELTLQNTVTEKYYDITLNQENEYTAEIHLNAGTYHVQDISNNMTRYNGITFVTNTETMELSSEVENELIVSIENTEEFTQKWMATQPMPEMILSDIFSRQIQINRKIIPIEDIVSELTLSHDMPIDPYEKVTLSDNDMGVRVTLLNNTEEAQVWSACDVIGIEVNKNTVVFPEGVTLGMSPQKVIHKTDGLYGEPTSYKGTLLFGWGLDNTYAIYSDTISGDKITIRLNPDGTYIMQITYEFALFE